MSGGRFTLIKIACLVGLSIIMLTAWGCGEKQKPKPPQPAPEQDLGLDWALWTAAGRCDKVTLEKLLKTKARVNVQRGRYGTTPIMEAVRHYDNKCPAYVVKRLIKAGADINARDFKGQTALHWAARGYCTQDLIDAIDVLLKNGADPYIRDYQCHTALELASSRVCVEKMEELAVAMEKAHEHEVMENDPCAGKVRYIPVKKDKAKKGKVQKDKAKKGQKK